MRAAGNKRGNNLTVFEAQSGQKVAIVGGGPAGLMAAEQLARAGYAVTVYDRMATLARKFQRAGIGGLNLTHSEPLDAFMARYGAAAEWMAPFVRAFPPETLRAWSEGLGHPTFVGSSGRVFPKEMKASPLLRAWLKRLDGLGVSFVLRSRWLGWDEDGRLRFCAADGSESRVTADAVLLALGGASWPQLGSDGAWTQLLAARGVTIAALRPANCGFGFADDAGVPEKFVGQPLKPVVASFGGVTRQGELMIARDGLEGGLIYAFSAALRDEIEAKGQAILTLDLRPGVEVAALARKLSSPRGSQSLSNFLRKFGGLSPQAIAILRAAAGGDLPVNPQALAALIKRAPLRLTRVGGMARAISSAGGVARGEVDAQLMLKKVPGLFVAGEMVDWEAPTGGYLLQGCFSTGVAAARGIEAWLRGQRSPA